MSIEICSGITSGRVLNGELLYAMILEVSLFAFTYRLFHEDFSSIIAVLHDTQSFSILSLEEHLCLLLGYELSILPIQKHYQIRTKKIKTTHSETLPN